MLVRSDRAAAKGINMATHESGKTGDTKATHESGKTGDTKAKDESGKTGDTKATEGSSSAAVTPGAYEFKDAAAGEEFNLGLKAGHARPVPADQAKLSKDVYETKNILKLLHSERRLNNEPYAEFIHRAEEAATAGLIGPDVETALAADALAQIRVDILRRIGRPLAFRYLGFLALWGVAAALIGLAIAAVGYNWPSDWASVSLIQLMGHYGWVLVGAMAGAWFGVAVRRWQIAFEELPGFLDVHYEPLIRMMFVAVVALVFALVLDLGVLNIKLGNIDLAAFGRPPGRRVETALLLGFIAGMSERAVSKQLVEQVGKALPQSGSRE
jgi:hypothetical protein